MRAATSYVDDTSDYLSMSTEPVLSGFAIAAVVVLSLAVAGLAWRYVDLRRRYASIERRAYSHEAELAAASEHLLSERELLDQSEHRFHSLFELSPVGIALNDLDSGRFVQANDALVGPSGYSRKELQALSFRDLVPAGKSGAGLFEALGETGHFGPVERECVCKDGSRYPVLVAGMLTHDSEGVPVAWSIIQDISERKAMESEVAEAAMRDKLTGLANRARFTDQLQAAIDRLAQGEQQRLCVYFLDFDRFKLVNDTLGHDAGDDLLGQMADRLRNTLRTSDAMSADYRGNLIARFGGDEFVILINDLKRKEDAGAISERLLNALAPTYRVKGHDIISTASIGVVASEDPATTTEDIIRNADVAMYEAKRSGRGCAVFFTESMHTRLKRQVTIESGLRKALGTSQLWLAYQPIVDLQSGRMVYAEALARWTHPDLGDIPPGEFIPVAEDRGLIIPLGDWVLREACRQQREWLNADPERAPQMVSVNLSRIHFSLGQALIARVVEILDEHELEPGRLQLEITENEVMHDPRSAQSLIRQLREIGVRIAMDDFGTGTSSLASLREYRFDSVKIDRTFLGDLGAGREMLAVLHTTVNLIENLGMASVAEGVETATQAALLQSLGCRFAQGFLYSKPLSAQKFFGSEPNADSFGTAAAG